MVATFEAVTDGFDGRHAAQLGSDLDLDVKQFLIDFQDHLAPTLDAYEQAIYLYLVRRIRLEGQQQETVAFTSARARLATGIGEGGKPMSESTARKKIQSLVDKAAIRVVDVTHRGTVFEVFLPSEIGVVPSDNNCNDHLDIDALDFYSDPNCRVAILEREERRCFYSLVELNEDNFVIDHVVPASQGGSNGYKNVVACSRWVNNRKGAKSAETFLRQLLREQYLDDSEFQDRIEALEKLQRGDLIPSIEGLSLNPPIGGCVGVSASAKKAS